MKTYMRLPIALFVILVFTSISLGMSQTRPATTLLIVPARHTPIQISMDIINRRPVTLVAYQTNARGELQLNVWQRSRWVLISLDDLEGVSFMTSKPARVVLVGDQNATRAIRAALKWCDRVELVEDVVTTPLLNDLGRIFNFSNYEWHWFGARYGCEINIVNKEDMRRSWYDQSRDEFIESEKRQLQSRGADVPQAEIVDEL